LSEEILRENQEGIRQQLAKFLDFDCGENSAEIVNNYDWFKEIGFLEFLREVGKYLTVNYMMSKDSVKNRLTTGISFTEFSTTVYSSLLFRLGVSVKTLIHNGANGSLLTQFINLYISITIS
jgi:tyrosyl-tRNA synthetase